MRRSSLFGHTAELLDQILTTRHPADTLVREELAGIDGHAGEALAEIGLELEALEQALRGLAELAAALREFLQLAAEAQIEPEVQEYELKDANQALNDLKQGRIRGAKVLRVQ